MPQFHNAQVDIWKPNRNLRDTGEIATASYTRAYVGIDCEVHELTAGQKLMMGMDVGLNLRKLYVGDQAVRVDTTSTRIILQGFGPISAFQGWRSISSDTPSDLLDQFYVIKTLQDNTFWIVNTPVNHWLKPKEFWEANLLLLRAPPREIS